MIPYLIKTILCSAFFMLFYKTVLGESKSYKFNRFYLIAALALSFIIPVLPLIPINSIPITTYFMPELHETTEMNIPVSQMEDADIQSDHNLLLYIYLLITGILVCRSFYQIFRLRKNVLRSKTQKRDDVVFVFTDHISSSYTFLNYIFVQWNRPLPEEIIRHEMTHVRQKHTLDILFIEFLLMICWFNPMLLLYRKYIALNHEYLADESAIKTGTDEKKYLNILLSFCSSEKNGILIHQFNNNKTIKKRVKMIMKTNSKTVQWLRLVAIAPLFVSALFLFSGNSYVKADNSNQQEDPQQESTIENDNATKTVAGNYEAIFKEYVQIIEKYVSGKEVRRGIILTSNSESELEKSDLKRIRELEKSDLNRINEIFQSMTPEQQSALPYILHHMKMPEPKTPTETEYESWKEPSEYGIWLDEKRIDNSELNKYKTSDFSLYFKSKLTRIAKNYGKHVYQLNLYTTSHYQVVKAKMDAVYFLRPNFEPKNK